MTGRERLERMIDGKPTDRVCMATLANDKTRSIMPPEWRDIPILEFYRKLGIDHMQLGDFALKPEQCPKVPFIRKCGYTTTVENKGEIQITRYTMNGKTLEMHYKDGHPIKYPIADEDDLELFCEMWESVEVTERTGEDLEQSKESYKRIDEEIGDMGIYVPRVGSSGVQRLLEFETGIENFYYLLEDAPELVERAIEAVQRERQKIYEALAKHVDCKTIIPIENTSTTMISPKIYRKYTLPHMQKYAETMHKYGKKAIIHMCGHLNDLLPELKEVNLDGIHAFTVPPVGNCTYDAVLDALGDNLVLFSNFDPDILRSKTLTVEEKRKHIKDRLSPRVLAGNFSFGASADGMPTPISHFELIRDAIFEFGVKNR